MVDEGSSLLTALLVLVVNQLRSAKFIRIHSENRTLEERILTRYNSQRQLHNRGHRLHDSKSRDIVCDQSHGFNGALHLRRSPNHKAVDEDKHCIVNTVLKD